MSESYQQILARMEEDDFFIGVDRYIQKNGWNVFMELVLQLKEKYNPRVQKIKKEYSLCSCITSLLDKKHLSHNERLALMMILLPMGKESELIEILRRQDNFKESVTLYQIANYKAKGKFKGISRAKLKEWKICKC